MGRYIFFEGAYDTLDAMSGQLKQACDEAGDEYITVDIRSMEEGIREIAAFVQEPVDAVITLNNLGLTMELVENKIIWDELDIVVVDILVDHPFHYHKALLNAPKKTVILCIDRKHVDYVKRFYPSIWKVGFLPHGGIPGEGTANLPLNRRSCDVIYAGGLSKYAAQGLVPDLSVYTDFDALELTREVLEELIRHPHRTTEEVIEEYLAGIGIHYSDDKLAELIMQLRFIDSFAVSYYRELSVRLLVEAGIRVRVFGAGWDQCDWADNENLDYRGLVPPQQILQEIKNARIVLNTMTWFKDGTHDRIYNGMLAGAVVVSDTSKYMEEQYQSGEELYLFQLEKIGELPKLAGEILEKIEKEPVGMQQVADAGYERTVKRDMWRNRMEWIRENYL